jgi:hypothetical protein
MVVMPTSEMAAALSGGVRRCVDRVDDPKKVYKVRELRAAHNISVANFLGSGHRRVVMSKSQRGVEIEVEVERVK